MNRPLFNREMVRLQARELLRDSRYFWFALIFPFFMLGLFLFLSSVVPSNPGGPDLKPVVVPIALFLAASSVGLTITAGPLAGLRSRGTLRLLGTTPLGVGRFLVTHVSVRLAFVIVQICALLAVAMAFGSIRVTQLPALLGVSLLGTVLFGAIGYLIGGRLRSPEVAANVGTLIQLGALFMSGLALPPQILPSGVRTFFEWIPSSSLGDLLLHLVPAGSPSHPAWVSVLVLVGTTVAFAVATLVTFRWDDGARV
ncbi:ABC transporter permease [Cryptosporangium minutisporangium]|uniref:ABC-2 type transporter transmembrane domain-containing protein n=1 Tax=Cryptosporangium minutisporangium TaxID=113569 RepID=A0ABP6SZ03_9ACTN